MAEIAFYKQRDGVIRLARHGEQPSILSDDDVQSPDFLRVMNALLAEQRLKAWDHEAAEHSGKNEMFFGAALIRTADNRFYVAANIHQKNSLTTRDCAEANAINQAAQDTEMLQLGIQDLWFMGGKGNLSEGKPILEGEALRRNCPCGSCRDVIGNTRLNGNTRVHMVPLNDGSVEVAYPEPGAAMQEHHIVTHTLDELLPHIHYRQADASGALKQTILDGWDYLHAPAERDTDYEPGRIRELEGVPSAELPARINQLLLDVVKQEMHHAERKPLQRATLVIVQTHSGRFYLGASYVDGRTMGMSPATLHALQNAGRQSVSEVYMLDVLFRKEDKQRAFFADNPQADVLLPMPDGESRDRIWKARDKVGENGICEPPPKVHVFALNNGRDFQPSLMHSFPIEELLPHAFMSPKHDPKLDVCGVVHVGECGHDHGPATGHGSPS